MPAPFKVKSTGLKVVKKAFKFGLSFYFLNDLVSKCGFLLILFTLPLCDKHFSYSGGKLPFDPVIFLMLSLNQQSTWNASSHSGLCQIL